MMVRLVVVSDGDGGVGRLRWWRWRVDRWCSGEDGGDLDTAAGGRKISPEMGAAPENGGEKMRLVASVGWWWCCGGVGGDVTSGVGVVRKWWWSRLLQPWCGEAAAATLVVVVAAVVRWLWGDDGAVVSAVVLVVVAAAVVQLVAWSVTASGGIEGAVQQGPGTWLESLADLSAEEKEDDSGRRNSQGYYVSVRALNDMRNIKMTMPRMQLNSKFVNNMLPEWSRFITEVKLNRGLKESNFDRCLGPTLKANEVMLMRTELCEGSVKPNNVPWH
ncbi:hypothetical protein Tco_0320455 [Tanacetum coccineum]